MIDSLRLAVPSNNPGGLEAGRSDHFGHCDLFTLINIKDGKIDSVETASNQEHGAGGCLIPVNFLKGLGVQALVVGGIGGRPLQGFAGVGIDVYYADRNSVLDVQTVVGEMIAGKLAIIRADQACQGHASCN